MNTANNLTRCRVSLVWLSTVAIALMLVVLNIAPVAAQTTEIVMLSNLGEAEAERYQRTQFGAGRYGHAQSFTTGSTAVTLEKVRLYLRGRAWLVAEGVHIRTMPTLSPVPLSPYALTTRSWENPDRRCMS